MRSGGSGHALLTSPRRRPRAVQSLEHYPLGRPESRNVGERDFQLEKQVDEVLELYELRERRDRGIRAGAIFAVLLTPLVLVAVFVVMVAPR